MKDNSTIKFDGVNSDNRVPSIGDYNRYLSEPGFIQVYGSLDFLNYMKLPLLLQNIGENKSKFLIISDRLNYRKSLLNKFLALDKNSCPNSI